MARMTALGWRAASCTATSGAGTEARTTPVTITSSVAATDAARVCPARTEMTAAIAPSVETMGATSDTWPMRRA